MVVGNTVISLAGQGITWISTLILTIAYGRFLGPSGFGELYLAITLVGLIGFPLEFGFNQQIIRDVAQTPERAYRVLTGALLLKGLLWAPLVGLLTLATWLLRYSPEERMLVTLFGVSLLISSIGAAFGSMHIAVHRNFAPVVGTILEKTLDAAVAFALLRYWHVGVGVVACVLLVGAAVNTTWTAVWFFRLEHPKLEFDLTIIREIVRTSIPFLIYGMLGVIYYRVDTVMLGAMSGDTAVGWYGAGYRIFDTLIFLPSLVMSSIMYPLMARLSQHEPQALKIAIEKSTNFLLVIGMPLAVGLGVAAPAIVGFLYHDNEFAHTVGVMEALAPGLIMLYMNSVIGNVIISVNRERTLTWMAGAALVLNVSLNFLLIPRFHEVAAAGVTSFTELMLLVIGLFVIPRELVPLGSVPTLVKTVAASAVMAVVIFALSHFSILTILPAAGLTYVAVAAFVRIIPREDLRSLLSAVRNKASHETPQADAESLATPQVEQGAATASYHHARLFHNGRTLAPEYAAWYEWLQAPTSSSGRARLVTRARSNSAPLTAAQVSAAQRSTPLMAGQRLSKRAAAPSAPARRVAQSSGVGSNVRARRRKAATKPRRSVNRVAVAI